MGIIYPEYEKGKEELSEMSGTIRDKDKIFEKRGRRGLSTTQSGWASSDPIEDEYPRSLPSRKKGRAFI